MIMDIVFKDFVYDETKCLRKNENGDILCIITDSEGKEDTAFLDEETLINSNILPRNGVQHASDDAQNAEGKELIEWSEDMTKMILDKYSEYISEVGPMKKFRTKKKMWECITDEINVQFNINRTAQQVDNRFKTVLKRKKKAVTNNHQSGSQRSQIEFEDELNKIASIDDSIEPEVMKDQNQCKTIVKHEKRKHTWSLSEVYKQAQEKKIKQQEQLHKEKEENKERRHKEKLELLRDLFSK